MSPRRTRAGRGTVRTTDIPTHDAEGRPLVAPRCGDCGTAMHLRRSVMVVWGLVWNCPRFPECRGSHGAHPDGRPLGVPGDEPTRRARERAHEAFDWWFNSPALRDRGYEWLAGRLGIARDACHFALFDQATCERVITICRTAMGRGNGIHEAAPTPTTPTQEHV